MLIKQKRKQAGISQKELAQRLGVNQASVCLWESGKNSPRVGRLQKIAEILGCTVEDLFETECKKRGNRADGENQSVRR